MKKQLTAVILCIVLVFASVLCGCDPFAGVTKRRLAERKKSMIPMWSRFRGIT